jgi:hypothetical protein
MALLLQSLRYQLVISRRNSVDKQAIALDELRVIQKPTFLILAIEKQATFHILAETALLALAIAIFNDCLNRQCRFTD